MKQLSLDTTLDAQHRHFDLMRRLPNWRRLQLAFDLAQLTRELVLSDLRYRFPNADDREIRNRFIARVLPREDVICADGFDPVKEGY